MCCVVCCAGASTSSSHFAVFLVFSLSCRVGAEICALHNGDDPLTPVCLSWRRLGFFAKLIADLASLMVLLALCFPRDGLSFLLLVLIPFSSILLVCYAVNDLGLHPDGEVKGV